MKTRHKIFSFIIPLIVFNLASCGESPQPPKPIDDDDDKPEVIEYRELNALSPYDGEYVYLVNDEMKEWAENFSYDNVADKKYVTLKEHCAPKPVHLEWNLNEKTPLYYRVDLSENESFNDSIGYTVYGKNFVDVSNLHVGKHYYWRVDAIFEEYIFRSVTFNFSTVLTPRTISIEGLSNTRDIGGYLTDNGKRVKQDLVYRCGMTEDVTTQKGRDDVRLTYKIKTELDLRNPDSIEFDKESYIKNGTPLGKQVNWVNISAPSYVYTCSAFGLNNPDNNYENDKIFGKEIKLFANKENYPIIFHCSAGRDRTGTLACILNALLGVNELDLIMDYTASQFGFRSTADDPDYTQMYQTLLRPTLDFLNSFEGSSLSQKTENYLLERCDVTKDEIATIRNIMLEEVK